MLTVPNAVPTLIMLGVPAEELMVMVSENGELVPPALVAVRVTGKLPAAVGVPVIAPEDVLKVRPVGSVPVSPKLVGELVAVVL